MVETGTDDDAGAAPGNHPPPQVVPWLQVAGLTAAVALFLIRAVWDTEIPLGLITIVGGVSLGLGPDQVTSLVKAWLTRGAGK